MIKKEIEKVGIITLNGYHNYGNRLQNYALQEIVKKLGFEVETIIIQDMHSNINIFTNYINKISKLKKISKIYDIVKKTLINYVNRKLINKRTRKFKDFSNKYIVEKKFNYCESDMENFTSKYNFFITGSDQVWKPTNNSRLFIYFLTFVESSKRIAYAPSFGVTNISNKHIENYKIWLTGMNKLSVREEAGAKIIKELTGRESEVLIDPTLMLSKEEWLSVSKVSSNKPKCKYILTYFLGGPTKEAEKKVKDIAEQNNLEIINLVDFKDKETYITGPSEFIDYINSASVFFTDSFHGVVFSILLQTPFVIYERVSKSASMYSRIETLLDMFNLRAREAHNIKDNDEIFEMDFTHVTPILELERKKAINYLKDALEVK